MDAWDEPHSGAEDGDQPGTLHQEGRAATLQLDSPNDLDGLSKLAVCAGFDFVQIRSESKQHHKLRMAPELL